MNATRGLLVGNKVVDRSNQGFRGIGTVTVVTEDVDGNPIIEVEHRGRDGRLCDAFYVPSRLRLVDAVIPSSEPPSFNMGDRVVCTVPQSVNGFSRVGTIVDHYQQTEAFPETYRVAHTEGSDNETVLVRPEHLALADRAPLRGRVNGKSSTPMNDDLRDLFRRVTPDSRTSDWFTVEQTNGSTGIYSSLGNHVWCRAECELAEDAELIVAAVNAIRRQG